PERAEPHLRFGGVPLHLGGPLGGGFGERDRAEHRPDRGGRGVTGRDAHAFLAAGRRARPSASPRRSPAPAGRPPRRASPAGANSSRRAAGARPWSFAVAASGAPAGR